MVFIDAGYLRRNLTNMFGDDILNYLRFIELLIDQFIQKVPRFYLERIRVYYYDSKPEEGEPDAYEQQAYLRKIRDIPGFVDRLGSLKRVKKDKRRQKEVDSLIAVDMVSMAYENQFDIALLIAGDEDHLPVIEAVKNTGKRVYGCFFEHNISQDLKDAFDIPFVLTQDWLVSTDIKNKISIIDFQFPTKVRRGEEVNVFAKIRGTVNNASLDLLLTDSKGRENSYPDPNSHKSKLHLEKGEHSSCWNILISNQSELRKGKAFMRIFETGSSGRSTTIALLEREFEVI